MKLHVKKGDTVLVLSGNDKGKQGKVMSVDPKSRSGIIKQEAPIHISNLMVVDNSGKPTRVGRRKDEKTGKSVRYSKKTGEIIK